MPCSHPGRSAGTRAESPSLKRNHHTTPGLVHRSGAGLKFKRGQILKRNPGERHVAEISGVRGKFQEFAVKGNAFDLAVGVIIGAAFGQIVTSLVGDIFMPVIGAVTGGLDFTNYFTGLSSKVSAGNLADAKKQGAVLAWGSFVTIVINFLIVAAVMFGLVNLIQRTRQREAAAPPAAPSRQEVLLQEIRDLLAKR